MQADLLGAHALGLRNLLLVTGRPQRQSEYPDARGFVRSWVTQEQSGAAAGVLNDAPTGT